MPEENVLMSIDFLWNKVIIKTLTNKVQNMFCYGLGSIRFHDPHEYNFSRCRSTPVSNVRS